MRTKTLEKLMLATGQYCFVRTDMERDKNRFTVFVGTARVKDTDDPAQALFDYLQPERYCCGEKIIYGCICGQNWTCLKCGTGAGSAPCNCRYMEIVDDNKDYQTQGDDDEKR